MSCVQWEERVALLVDSALPPAETATVEAHIARCADCAELRLDLDQIRVELGALRDIEPGESELDAVRRRVLEQAAAPQTRVAWFTWLSVASAAAALAAASFIWFMPQRETLPTPVATMKAVEQPRLVASLPFQPPRPRIKRAAAAPAGVVVESARRMTDDGDGPPAQLVRVRTEDPRVAIYWVIEEEGESSR